jgi:hypothetical protein
VGDRRRDDDALRALARRPGLRLQLGELRGVEPPLGGELGEVAAARRRRPGQLLREGGGLGAQAEQG